MILPIAGTIRSAVKLAELDRKWQQKKKKGGQAFSKEIDPQIRQFQEDLKKMRENRKMGSITSKLKSGAELTSEEIEYLRINAPEAYREYLEVRAEREAYERQLKACRTKEDVERLKFNKMGSLLAEAKAVLNNPNIPEGKKLGLAEKILKKTMAVNIVHIKFVESGRYQQLPDDAEMAEEKKEKRDISQNTEIGRDTAEEIKDEEAGREKAEEDAGQEPLEVRQAEAGNSGERIFEDIVEITTKYVKARRGFR